MPKPTKASRAAAHILFRPLRTLTQYPEGHLLNPATRYTPASRTDVAATWERARKRMQIEAAPKQASLFGQEGGKA